MFDAVFNVRTCAIGLVVVGIAQSQYVQEELVLPLVVQGGQEEPLLVVSVSQRKLQEVRGMVASMEVAGSCVTGCEPPPCAPTVVLRFGLVLNRFIVQTYIIVKT